jgi:hypothetical protein
MINIIKKILSNNKTGIGIILSNTIVEHLNANHATISIRAITFENSILINKPVSFSKTSKKRRKMEKWTMLTRESISVAKNNSMMLVASITRVRTEEIEIKHPK